ncbi:response regulator transcription factor [Treponema sp. HNW]|uniref:response regulator n=1 Tax=Treponema sp. HNW TaxID=3116654 RepID=UPI003D1241D7
MQTTHKKQKILLVEDQFCFAVGLKTFLTNYAQDLEVIGIADNGQKGVEMTKELEPDIILMDVRMPVMDGISAVKIIKKDFPNIRIVMLSTYDEDEFVREAILSGASGYLLKDTSPTELIISIRALNTGITLISPDIAKDLVRQKYIERSPYDKRQTEWLSVLTRREREIFALLATGHDNEQIAETLHISLRTVRNQVSIIYAKLEVKDRFEIIQLANRLRPV